ncbi:MAG: PorT family protein [Gemmatimonadota bacterium]|nr:PorT family protein [Gemmatimonadota bacterium]MDH3368548.1 PorT family protein [Gemmatimonadota bacterium]MDH3479629.1 PorT family protein [Gemmatimonadota bacterium]MDH3570343.1 PorT family protein [Gemmatimonadota bacterium]MDH5549490.1 PorT family protein [Gemmatimonadota bacterium]
MLKASRALPVAVLLLILPGMAAAQSVSVGVLGGFNLVSYTGSSVESGWRPALRAGGTVMVALGPKLELAGEVTFSDLGTNALSLERAPSAPGIVETRNSVSLSHIVVPILVSAVLPVSPDGRIAVRLGGGPSVGYRARCSAVTRVRTLDETGAILSSSTTEDTCGGTARTIDVGLAANAGVRFRQPWGDLFTDARYRIGLASPVAGSGGRFQQMSVSVGVAFGL